MAQNDELLFRQMPHSLEAEQAALGAMLIDADCIKDVMDKLQPEDFYIKQNRDVFETIYTMFSFSKPIDGVFCLASSMPNWAWRASDTSLLVTAPKSLPLAPARADTFQGDGVSMSGRSLGEVNVQVILERLGGGGNATAAGGHVSGADLYAVRPPGGRAPPRPERPGGRAGRRPPWRR